MKSFYLDTEFNEFGGELISMALVPETGDKTLYMIFPEPRVWGKWVFENVFPILDSIPDGHKAQRVSRKMGAALVREYFADAGCTFDDPPRIITDYPEDIRHFCDLIMTGPGTMIGVSRIMFDMVRVNAYPSALEGAVQHNALWDALALRYLMA